MVHSSYRNTQIKTEKTQPTHSLGFEQQVNLSQRWSKFEFKGGGGTLRNGGGQKICQIVSYFKNYSFPHWLAKYTRMTITNVAGKS